MAFKRRRFTRRGQKPLLRWTAVNPGAFTFTVDIEGANAENPEILVDPSVYQQNEQLEPDGATLRRCIIDYYHVAQFNPGTTLLQPFGVGLFFDHCVIVHDVNADLTGILANANWSDTMIKERILWYGSHDYTFTWTPRQGTAGTANAAQAVTTTVTNDIVPIEHHRVDFRVAAKLVQNKAVTFYTQVSVVGIDDASVTGNVRMQSRILIGGRF